MVKEGTGGRLICEDPLIADALLRSLGPLAQALAVDLPLGILLRRNLRGRVAVTTATGPLYLADLLDRGPRALVVGCQSLDELAMILRSLRTQPDCTRVYHGPPLGRLSLTRSERRFLNAYLRTDSLEDAARELGIQKKTASNRLSLIKEKLGVQTHGQLLQAYFGLPEN